MEYFSTRNKELKVSSSQAILQGMSRDGGLFVPISLPLIEDLDPLMDMDYREMALFILEKFFPQLGNKNLKEAVNRAYDTKFTNEKIVDLKTIMGVNFLELFHGPTLAFKDMALSILPHLLKFSKAIEGIDKEIVILTATSGDTGKAALEGFAHVEGIKIIVFFPEKGVSKVQQLQMITQEGENTFVVGIKGNFDHAQSGVKAIFNDENFKEELKKDNYILSSANSINIGRLIPQIVYYFYSYCQLVKRQEIIKGEKINIVVPTGNFGNILAAYYGKHMGLPVNKLISASNNNNVLTEFFNKGKYDRRRELILTSSPSMDILISSNLERLLFQLTGEDEELVKDKMKELSEKGYYETVELDTSEFYSNYADEEDVNRSIRDVFMEGDYLIDPHTAVAYSVYKKYKEDTKDETKTIIASTASPFKFGKKVASSIGIDIRGKDEFFILEELSKKTGISIPENIKSQKDKPIVHKNISTKENMKNMIKGFLRVGDIYG